MVSARRGIFVLAFGALLAFGSASQPEPPEYVTAVRLEGMVDDGMAVLVDRAIREVADSKALIFIIDTPGGRVDSAFNIVDKIVQAPCKTVAYITGEMGAISAGALISYACDEIVMSPSANIGAAQPVMMSQQGMEPLGEKETSVVRAKFATIAEMKGHNPDIARAMVDKDIELRAFPQPDGSFKVQATDPETKAGFDATEVVNDIANDPEDAIRTIAKLFGVEIPDVKPDKNEEEPAATEVELIQEATASAENVGGIVIDSSDKLLTLTPQEAKKYGVIKYISKDLDQVLWDLSLNSMAVVTITPTWSEDLYKWLISPEITLLLLVLGVGGLYIEFKTPGFGLPGIVGICALTIFFGSRYVVGLADWLDVALLITGIILVLVEIFIVPGFGVIGALGIIFVLAGIVMSFTFDDYQLPQYSWQWDRLEDAGFAMTMTMFSMVLIVLLTWKFLPKTPLYSRLVLADQQLPQEGYTAQIPQEAEATIGRKGIATSMLRPAGRGRFGDKTYQVVSLSEYIEEGTPIVIVQAEGNRYVVDRIKKTA